jgi:putative two-component system response regulator
VKVLVVDDVAYSRRALRSVFFSAGYAVLTADDGQQALEIVQREMPDLVVTDILMPRMDGFQLCRAIKTDPRTKHIPVVFYTGSYNEAADREFGLSLGAVAYLVKPLEPRQLIGEVTRAIGHPTPELQARPAAGDDWAHTHAERLALKLQEKVSELNRAISQVDEAYTGTVAAFALALAEREGADPIEAERPARLAQLFCERFVPELAADPNVFRGFLLHDIGKLMLPDGLLRKESPLTTAEWDLFKRQPARAAEILRNVPGLGAALDIVRHSRERWDGAGYPDGLAREAIPHAARIFAVCDAFVAITQGRPYRPRQPVAWALEEIRKRAGSQFDPGLVEPFVILVNELQPSR